MKPRIAFDLDETLGVPILDASTMVGWQVRPGAVELLTHLAQHADLILWSVAPRRYVAKALGFGLGQYFAEVIAWEDEATSWKEVRRFGVDWLIDDSPHHRDAAARAGIAERYIVVPGYGSPEDAAPLAWVRQVTAAVCR